MVWPPHEHPLGDGPQRHPAPRAAPQPRSLAGGAGPPGRDQRDHRGPSGTRTRRTMPEPTLARLATALAEDRSAIGRRIRYPLIPGAATGTPTECAISSMRLS